MVKLFVDSGDKNSLLEQLRSDEVHGATTNPTLMRNGGVTDYQGFACELLSEISDKPISFEVFAETFDEMERQARLIATWGNNVYVKIPVTDVHGESSAELVRRLSEEGVKLNVTAILTADQVRTVARALSRDVPSIISVFAGRIADTGVDPIPIMKESLEICREINPLSELLWASPRETLNITQAEQIGCHIITAQPALVDKYRKMTGMDLTKLSLETVRMFDRDAKAAGFHL